MQTDVSLILDSYLIIIIFFWWFSIKYGKGNRSKDSIHSAENPIRARPKGINPIIHDSLPLNTHSRFEFAMAILQAMDRRSRSHAESIRDPLVRGKKTFSEMTSHRCFFERE